MPESDITESEYDSLKPICQELLLMERSLKMISGKWKLSILIHLGNENIRFNTINRLVKEATTTAVTNKLKEMVDDDLINRNVISYKPCAVEYEITDKGKRLLTIMHSLKALSE